jgi:hypothetical protein
MQCINSWTVLFRGNDKSKISVHVQYTHSHHRPNYIFHLRLVEATEADPPVQRTLCILF